MQKAFFTTLLLLAATLALAQQFTTDTFQLVDVQRNRSIPCKVYMPQPMTGIYPVIIFSHGLGGSRNAATYLGEYLTAHGYVCFHLQHPGSDESVWRDAAPSERISTLKSSLLSPSNAINRFEDIPFVVQQIDEMNSSNNLFKGHLNLNAIGMAGHSYGAVSTMVACGQKLAGRISRFAVPEIKAGLVLSPSAPQNARGDISRYYDGIQVPLLHITGTKDGDPLNRKQDFDPAERQQPYYNITTSPQYLLVLDGANHASFGGSGSMRLSLPSNDRYHEEVNKAALAFFDAYLKQDGAQQKWLKVDFRKSLDKADKFEYKQ